MNRMLLALTLGLALTACAPREEAPAGGPTPAATTGASGGESAVTPQGGGTAAAPTSTESPMAASSEGGVATPATEGGDSVGADNPAKLAFPDTERVQIRPLTTEGTTNDELSKTLAGLPEADRGKPAFLAETSEGTPLGVAYETTVEIDDKPTNVIVGMAMDGTIRRVVVQNSPNEAVAGSAFLDQFMGKTSKDLEDEGLVRPAEGADGPSKEILAAVRRAALILDHGILDPAKQTAGTTGVKQE